MKIKFLPVLLLAILISGTLTAGSFHGEHDAYNVRFVRHPKQLPDEARQSALRNTPEWQQFIAQHNNWWVWFDEASKMPHRAFGNPIQIPGFTSPVDAANHFIGNQLKGYISQDVDLVQTGNSVSPKYVHVNYVQNYQGLEVLFSNVVLKMTADNSVAMFGLEIFTMVLSLQLIFI